MLEQDGALKAAQIGRPAERVARRGDVVVSQHGVRAVPRAQPPKLRDERPNAPAPADQVAGDRYEVEVAPAAQSTVFRRERPLNEIVPRWKSDT